MRLTPKKATKSSKLTPQSSKKVPISLEQPKETFSGLSTKKLSQSLQVEQKEEKEKQLPEVSKGSSLEFIKF